jgi:hypothetical protein
MTASTGLPTLRLCSNAIPMEEGYYEHDGTEAGIRRILDRIGSELATYALPWFRSRAEEASHDRLLQHGFDWLRAQEPSIPATIQDDVRQAFVQASHRSWRVELPVFDALKSELRRRERRGACASFPSLSSVDSRARSTVGLGLLFRVFGV